MQTQLDQEKLEQWERVVSEVSKEHIPLHCVKKLILKLRGNRRKTINVQTLKDKGMDIDDIESVVQETLIEYQDEIVNIDFIIDVVSVAEYIQPITDNLLKNL